MQVRKTEASLKRLKKGRAAEGAGADGALAMSDTDKISMQLFLDVQARRQHPCSAAPRAESPFVATLLHSKLTLAADRCIRKSGKCVQPKLHACRDLHACLQAAVLHTCMPRF